ncbi:MAG: nitroreductase family protein [Anaerolineaceae bacterium]
MERDKALAGWAVELMQERQSVRNFTNELIPEEVLRAILEAGINAATGGNLQPYSIIVEKDEGHNQRLAEMCGGQEFMAQAPVNLVFLLDWHKLAVYSRSNDAPFTCNKSFQHYSIGMDDLVCCAQAIETAAWLYGIGSCYVGTILNSIPECAEMYRLPKLVAPVLILTLGYPKRLSAWRKKLDYEMVVFEGAYPDLSAEQICAGFDRKYQGARTALPKDETRRQKMLEDFRRALLTTYNEKKSEEIIRAADEDGSVSEIQRRFGLHYHAEDMLSQEVIQGLADQGIYPFYGWI